MDVADQEAEIPRSLQQLCRLCLGDESLEDIFKQEEDIHEWISDFLSIVVCVDDKMSKSICFCCRTRLHEFRNFQLQCLEVQDVLQGELTAVLNEKALELIVTDAHNENEKQNNVDIPVQWDEVAEIQEEESLSNELQIDETVKDAPERQSEWEGDESSVEISEPIETEAENQQTESASDWRTKLAAKLQAKIATGTVTVTRFYKEEIPTKVKKVEISLECDVCGKVCQNKKQFYNHRTQHVKNNKCTLCDKAFHRPRRLEIHMRTHRNHKRTRKRKETTATPQVEVINNTEQVEVIDNTDQVDAIDNTEQGLINNTGDVEIIDNTEDVEIIENTEVVEVIDVDDLTDEKDDVVFVEPIPVENETTIVQNDVVESIKVEELIIEDVVLEEESVPQPSSIDDEWAPSAGKDVGLIEAVGNTELDLEEALPKSTVLKTGALQCDQCGKQFQNKKQIHGHRWFVHGPKNHKCPVCDKGFVSPARLAVHQKYHKVPIVIDITKGDNSKQSTGEQEIIAQRGSAVEKSQVQSFNVKVFNAKERLVQCDLCPKNFETSLRLRTHKRLAHGPKRHGCPICGKRFSAKERVYAHMVIHKEKYRSFFQPTEETFDVPVYGPRVHLCSVCRESFVLLKEREAHMEAHRQNKDYAKHKGKKERLQSKMVIIKDGDQSYQMFQCSQCPKLVATRNQLFDHRKRVHRPKKYGCPVCGKPAVTRQDMELHLKSHTSHPKPTNTLGQKVGSFTCGICNKEFSSNKSLLSHHKYVHAIKRYTCPLPSCKWKFPTSSNLKKHMETHLPSNKRMYQCPICVCRFMTKTMWEEHTAWHDRKEKLRERIKQDELKNEDQTAVVIDLEDDGIEEQPSVGEKVEGFIQSNSKWMEDSSSKKPAVLEVRYGTVQDVDGRLKRGCEAIQTMNCIVCEQDIQASLMEGHLNRHAGVRPYKCEKGCEDMYFYCQLLLKTHYTRAHGNTPTECDICHKVYPSKLRMKSHKKEVHEKIHVCMNCPQIFDSSESLQRHIETANHAKRYPCKKCNASFDRQYQLNKHIRIKRHGDKKVSKPEPT